MGTRTVSVTAEVVLGVKVTSKVQVPPPDATTWAEQASLRIAKFVGFAPTCCRLPIWTAVALALVRVTVTAPAVVPTWVSGNVTFPELTRVPWTPVPLKARVALGVAESLGMRTEPVKAAAASGEKVTPKVQVPLAATTWLEQVALWEI